MWNREPTLIRSSDEDYEKNQYTASKVCVQCKRVTETKVPAPGLFAWRRGMAVQDAFPEMEPHMRELMFISGVCKTCFDDLFMHEDDEED